MKKSEAQNLSAIFGSEQFKYGGIPSDVVVKIVQTQIIVDPVAKELRDAYQKAVDKFKSDRLIELSKLVGTNKLKPEDIDYQEYITLDNEFASNMNKTLEPINNEEIQGSIPCFTLDDFEAICKVNEFTGSIPKLLYTLLVK